MRAAIGCMRVVSHLVAAQKVRKAGMSAQAWRQRQHAEASGAHLQLRWASAFALGSGLAFLELSQDRDDGDEVVYDENENSSSLPPVPLPSWKGLVPDAFRRRHFFNYEKKLRLWGSPEKVFDYFASERNAYGERVMKPADLMRAIITVLPPSDSNLVRLGSLRGEPSPGELYCPPSQFFLLFDTNGDGYISFSEYIFLVTLLSIPESEIAATLKMFDLDHDGKIDMIEFKKVMKMLRSWTRQGVAQRDGLRTGFKIRESVDDGGLIKYFFGANGDGYLSLDDFEKFVMELHEEMIRLEFMHYDFQDHGTISAKDFALSMVAAADVTRVNDYLGRVDELGKDPDFSNIQISFEEFWNFSQLRKKLQPLSLAISSYGEVYGFLSKSNFQQASAHVCGIPISDNVLDVVFSIFDTDGDGTLCTEEFLSVLERRQKDLLHPQESEIARYARCMCNRLRDFFSTWLYR